MGWREGEYSAALLHPREISVARGANFELAQLERSVPGSQARLSCFARQASGTEL